MEMAVRKYIHRDYCGDTARRADGNRRKTYQKQKTREIFLRVRLQRLCAVRKMLRRPPGYAAAGNGFLYEKSERNEKLFFVICERTERKLYTKNRATVEITVARVLQTFRFRIFPI